MEGEEPEEGERSVIEDLHLDKLRYAGAEPKVKGRSCLVLMDRYPDRYPSPRAIAEKLSLPEEEIRGWIKEYRRDLLGEED